MEKDNPNKAFTSEKAKDIKGYGLIQSSSGNIEVDLRTGKIIDIYTDDDEWEEWVMGNVTNFDLDEYREFYHDHEGRDREFDILDLGFWEGDQYFPPSAKYRQDIKQDMIGDAQL